MKFKTVALLAACFTAAATFANAPEEKKATDANQVVLERIVVPAAVQLNGRQTLQQNGAQQPQATKGVYNPYPYYDPQAGYYNTLFSVKMMRAFRGMGA